MKKKQFIKRIIAMFLTFLLFTSLTGCNSASSTNSSNNQNQQTAALAQPDETPQPDLASQNEEAPAQTEEASTEAEESSTQSDESSSQAIKQMTLREEGEKYQMRDISTMELVHEMGIGINLGNTLEACGDWINSSSISNYEQAWGSPIITEEMIAGYAKAGFASVRIPVAWSNMMADDYTIHPDLFDRVETVVNYVIDNGMVALVNIHWDNGWFDRFPEDYDECMKKYVSIWTQISERFKDYGDLLMFESMNEIGYDSVWNQYGGVNSKKEEAFGLVNSINQAFVDTVRAGGGNNAKRHLLIEGYYTNINHTCDPMFKMPDDPENRCAVTVHYYDPPTFAILEEDASWGKARATWGTDEDYANLNRDMDKMKTTFVDKGIPVIVGEYAACGKNKTQEMRRLYEVSVTEAVYSRGMCPMLWDTPGGNYDRILCEFLDKQTIEEFQAIIANTKR